MTQPVRVLLVEDNPADVFLVARQVSQLARPVALRTVGTAAAACAVLAASVEGSAERPDLVLLDLNLPMDGGEHVLAMQRETPALRDVAVVVLSTSAAPEDAARCLALGARAYHVKPDTAAALAVLLQQLLDAWVAAR